MRIFLIITKSVVCSQVFFYTKLTVAGYCWYKFKKKFRLDG